MAPLSLGMRQRLLHLLAFGDVAAHAKDSGQVSVLIPARLYPTIQAISSRSWSWRVVPNRQYRAAGRYRPSLWR